MTQLFQHRLLATCMALGAATLPLPALAQGDPANGAEPVHRGLGVGLGLGLATDIRPYRDVDPRVQVWPMVAFENRWLRILGPGLELKLGASGPWSYGLTLSYSGDGYDAGDSPALAGMAKRHASAWVGARVGLRSDWGELSAHWSTDAASHSQGQRLALGIERRLALGAFGLSPRATLTWLDRRHVQYYYGVEAGEARAGRAAYRPGSTLNTALGVRLDHRLAPQQMLFADLGVTALGSAIRASPLVDRRTLPELRAGWLYRF